jgi:hypothetical protein
MIWPQLDDGVVKWTSYTEGSGNATPPVRYYDHNKIKSAAITKLFHLYFSLQTGVRVVYKLSDTYRVNQIKKLPSLFAYSLDCREGHMKKNSLCVCVFVSGSKEHIKQKFSFFVLTPGFRPIGFLDGLTSTNQVFLTPGFRPMVRRNFDNRNLATRIWTMSKL